MALTGSGGDVETSRSRSRRRVSGWPQNSTILRRRLLTWPRARPIEQRTKIGLAVDRPSSAARAIRGVRFVNLQTIDTHAIVGADDESKVFCAWDVLPASYCRLAAQLRLVI